MHNQIYLLIYYYSLHFILVVVLHLCTKIKKIFNFAYFQKTTITYISNHILTNKKINRKILYINFKLKL